MINNQLKDIYFQNCIDIIENYNIVTYNKNFYDDFGLLAEPSYYLGPQLDPGFYNIKGTKNSKFHYQDHVEKLDKYYEKYGKDDYSIGYDDALNDTSKKIIVTMGFHPRQWNVETIRINFFDKLFEDTQLLRLLREGRAHLYLYFGYEADNFYFKEHKNLSYHKIFYDTIKDYGLNFNSLIIHSSNARGYDQHLMLGKEDESKKMCYIYETAYESQTFTSVKGHLDIDYTFDDYINNCKKSSKRLLRINRTSLNSRDLMLSFLYKKNYLSDCLMEHKNFGIDSENLIDYSKGVLNSAHDLGLKSILPYIKISESDIKEIQKLTPFISSELESNGKLNMIDIYSNESIPHDVYSKTIFSWVSTSLSEREDQVFINTSTYNPILYYHPIVYHGNSETARYMHLNGYLSYNWLYNEQKQDLHFHNQGRLAISISEIEKLMDMNKDDLIDLILQNRHIMEFNREKLIACDSIRRIINRLHDILLK